MKLGSVRGIRPKPSGASPCCVALIRGINVGGARPLKMARLKELFEGLGMREVRTYLQSGNVVFSPGTGAVGTLAGTLEREIHARCGLEVSVAVFTSREMEEAFRNNPLLGKKSVNPDFLHATFLVEPKQRPPLDAACAPLGPGEQVAVRGDVVYLYCPNGYSNTKLQNGFFERKFQARATTRNWRTVSALVAMASGGER